ncbi:MAG: hypothetical protein K9J13_14185 [Saprospiraceae bacterium]|nr:hypothetical protein [Saprospiraceae bacterium]
MKFNVKINKLVIVLIVLLIGCNNPNSDTTTNIKTDSIPINKEQLIEQSNLLDGFWLTNNYLLQIENSKSIYLSREYDTKLYGFILEKENLLSDSAWLHGFTEHEGGYSSLLIFDYKKNIFINDLKRKEDYSSFPESFELKITKNNLLEMYFPNSKTTDTYRKVIDNQTELRRILFEGNYYSSNNERKFSFNQNGLLDGFDDKVYYELVVDFLEGIFYDAIILFPTEDGGNWPDGDMYKYEFDNDTLKLYYIKADWNNFEHEVGDISYKLIKE